MHAPIRGRRRILTPALKAELCRLVAESVSIEAAADTLDVSLRTVQRERKNDEDFDHELRLSLQAEPDPKKLMQTAARTHWRAAAWLLERTDPETYARRPVNTANPKQVEAALGFLLEAALQATPADQRLAFFEKVNAARDQAFDSVFPNLGPWGHPRAPKCPPSPLADYFTAQQRIATARVIPDYDEQGNILPSPPRPAPPTFEEVQAAAAVRTAEQAGREAKLRQYREGLRCASDPSEYLEPSALHTALPAVGGVSDADAAQPLKQGILSPKIDFATKFPMPGVRAVGCHALAPQGVSMEPQQRRECHADLSTRRDDMPPTEVGEPLKGGPLTHPSAERERAPLSDEAQMAAWSAAHRNTPFHQALQRTRNAQAKKQRAAAKRRKTAKRQARRQAG